MLHQALVEIRPHALLAVLAVSFGCSDRAQPLARDLSRSAELLDLDGRAITLPQAPQDQLVVAIFTRTDCPISNRYAPEVRALCERFELQGVAFYLVYVDPRETSDSIRAHLAEYEYPCAALRDPQHALVAATGATVTPEAVVIDRDGQIKYRGRISDQHVALGTSRSWASRHDLAEAIEATLAGRPVAEPVTKAVGCYIEDVK